MNQAASAAVSVRGLVFRYPGSGWRLEVASLDVRRGEKVFLHGRSGSGKSTMLDLLAGVLIPSGGKVELLGVSMTSLSASGRDSFRADHMGYIFQQFNLIPFLTVEQNILLQTRFSSKRRQAAENQGALTDVADRLLEELGLSPEVRHRKAGDLSVGQQQRVAVCRALIGDPEIIVADEPTSALDRESQQAFIDLLLREAQRANCAVIFASHDASLAEHFDREISIEDGVLHGPVCSQ